jgi:hypothetical protein
MTMKHIVGDFFCFSFLRQGLIMWLRLALNP